MISQEELTCVAKCKTLLNILFACSCLSAIVFTMYVFLKGRMDLLKGIQGSVASVLGNVSRSNLV